MAAHVVVDFPISESKTTFTGTSDEDSAHLKIFWKSIHLNPTIESRLVSSDVRQRINSLPLKSHGSQTSNADGGERQSFTYRESDPPKLEEYHKHVHRLESTDQYRKKMELLDKREAGLIHHKNMRNKREQVQDSAKQRSVKVEPYIVLPPITPEYNDDLDPALEAELEAQQTISDINQFDECLTYRIQGKEPINENSIVLD